jgi:hypothetical protein
MLYNLNSKEKNVGKHVHFATFTKYILSYVHMINTDAVAEPIFYVHLTA